VSITQLGIFLESRPLVFAINHVDSKQRNKIFLIFFKSAVMEVN